MKSSIPTIIVVSRSSAKEEMGISNSINGLQTGSNKMTLPLGTQIFYDDDHYVSLTLEYWPEGVVIKTTSAVTPNDPAVFELRKEYADDIVDAFRAAFQTPLQSVKG